MGKEKINMKIKLSQYEAHFVTRKILDGYIGQSHDLPVTFKCEDGDIMKCSGRLLMLSDFWCGQIGGAIKFNNPMEFDFTTNTPTSKCFPKQVIKTYLDFVHL